MFARALLSLLRGLLVCFAVAQMAVCIYICATLTSVEKEDFSLHIVFIGCAALTVSLRACFYAFTDVTVHGRHSAVTYPLHGICAIVGLTIAIDEHKKERSEWVWAFVRSKNANVKMDPSPMSYRTSRNEAATKRRKNHRN